MSEKWSRSDGLTAITAEQTTLEAFIRPKMQHMHHATAWGHYCFRLLNRCVFKTGPRWSGSESGPDWIVIILDTYSSDLPQ